MLVLPDLLDLEEVRTDVWTGPNEEDRGHGRLFGGQVLAQALRAASHTVAPDRLPHSAHAYFLRPGVPSEPVMLVVHRDRDGNSFSARRVVASQGELEIFTMLCSFHRPEESGKLELPLPDGVPDPNDDDRVAWFRQIVDLIVVKPPLGPDREWTGPPTTMWTRSAAPLGDDPIINACALAYVSDIGVGFGSVEIPNLARGGPTIDHALWFEDPIRVDDWVLLDYTPWKAGGARGVYTGTIHGRNGALGATMAQEVLLRAGREWRPPSRSSTP